MKEPLEVGFENEEGYDGGTYCSDIQCNYEIKVAYKENLLHFYAKNFSMQELDFSKFHKTELASSQVRMLKLCLIISITFDLQVSWWAR